MRAPPRADVPKVRLCVLAERHELAPVGQPPEVLHGRVCLDAADDLAGAGAPVDEVHVAVAPGDGENVATRVERAHVHAVVRIAVVGVAVCKGRAPQPARRPRCCPRLQIVCVIERTVASEKDGGAGGVELCVGDGQRGDVKGLQVWVRVSVDLDFYVFILFSVCWGEW